MRGPLAALGVWLIASSGALAGLTICNDTTETQSVALGYKGDTDWTSQGWWNIAPGDCATPIGGDLTQRYYYYHANSKGGGFRGQNYVFCTRSKVFEIVGDTDCADRGYEKTEFREIDTGASARDFTLTLRSAAVGQGGPVVKAPGGGKGGGEIATQTVTEAPATPPVEVDMAALETDLPPGRSGEPFRTAALFQGCELEKGKASCGFHSDGVKYRVFYGGPTPDDLLFALEEMALNTPVQLEGDMVEPRGQVRVVVLRSVQSNTTRDPFATDRAALQGDWVGRRDRQSEITIHGSEIFVRYGGEFKAERFLRLEQRCAGSRGGGPVLVQVARGSSDEKCYEISQSDNLLELRPVRGGDPLLFARP